MDGFLDSHPELIPLVVVVMWVVISSILGALSGWYALMERYPAREEKPLLTLKNQSGSMRIVAMNGLLTLSVCPSGLRVGMTKILGVRLFGLFQRDFLVPWHEFSVLRKKGLFGRSARLDFGRPPLGNLTIEADVADRLARAAGKNWPEAGPLPLESTARIARELFLQWLLITAFVAAFFTFVPRLSGPKGHVPLAVSILFPAVAVGIGTLVRFFQRTRR
jgi:hypothetical protein